MQVKWQVASGDWVTMNDVAARLSYKPGWKFAIDEGDAERPKLVITAAVLHSETLEPVTFKIQRLIPRCARTGAMVFIGWIKDMLEEAEIHEMREFFRFSGELVDNPHASEAAE